MDVNERVDAYLQSESFAAMVNCLSSGVVSELEGSLDNRNVSIYLATDAADVRDSLASSLKSSIKERLPPSSFVDVDYFSATLPAV